MPSLAVISSFSGNLPSSFLEKINSPFFLTSKTPPPEGISSKEEILFLYALSNVSARPAAFGR